MKKAKYKSPHAFSITSHIFGSNHHICSVFLLFSLFHTKNAGSDNCSHQLWTPFHFFLPFPELLRCFGWEVLTLLKRSNLQFIEWTICNLQGLRRNNLQFTGPFLLLALGSLLGCWYRWRFLWLTSEEFFWSTGRLECLPDDLSLYPLFLPLPLIFEWYQ